jgi:hypothetical protein
MLNNLRKLADGARQYASDLTGIRTNRVTIRTRTWSGTRLRQGDPTDVDLELPARYPVRYLTGQEISSSAGQYETGDVLVRHITPSDGTGVGYTPAQLQPAVTTNNVELIYILVGEHAGEYTLIDLRTFRPFSYEMVLRRKSTTP